MKNNIAVAVNADKQQSWEGITGDEAIKYIKKAGFKKVFLSWMYDSWGESQEKIVQLCKENNLEIIFAHVSYYGDHLISQIWEEGEDGENLTKLLIKDLKILAKHNIPIAVIHPSSQKPNIWSKLGLNRWKKVIKQAEKLGIIVAFENLRYKEVLDYLFTNIESPNMKICYDFGHDHCHFKDTFDFEKYKGKVVATHVHDNDGTIDAHHLPFDGNINWQNQLRKLKSNNQEVCLTGELYCRERYISLNPLKFYKQVYKRLKKLEKIYNSI